MYDQTNDEEALVLGASGGGAGPEDETAAPVFLKDGWLANEEQEGENEIARIYATGRASTGDSSGIRHCWPNRPLATYGGRK